jgi:hypothetical protein
MTYYDDVFEAGINTESNASAHTGFFSWDDEMAKSDNPVVSLVGHVLSIPDRVAHMPVDLAAVIFNTKEGGVGERLATAVGGLVDTGLSVVLGNALPTELAALGPAIIKEAGIGNKVAGSAKSVLSVPEKVLSEESTWLGDYGAAIGDYMVGEVLSHQAEVTSSMSNYIQGKPKSEPSQKAPSRSGNVKRSAYIPSWMHVRPYYGNSTEKKQSRQKAVIY